jgi:biotin transport system permease protein
MSGAPSPAPLLRRLPAGVKLGGLAIFASALFLLDHVAAQAAALVLGLALLASTKVALGDLARRMKAPLVMFALIAAVDAWMTGFEAAAIVFLRLSAIAAVAEAVTLTTTAGEMTAAFEAGLTPFARLGLLDARRVALTLSLAIRFVPVIAEEAREIREAQAARGLERSILALTVPLVVRILVRAEELADAIDARGLAQPASDRVRP